MFRLLPQTNKSGGKANANQAADGKGEQRKEAQGKGYLLDQLRQDNEGNGMKQQQLLRDNLFLGRPVLHRTVLSRHALLRRRDAVQRLLNLLVAEGLRHTHLTKTCRTLDARAAPAAAVRAGVQPVGERLRPQAQRRDRRPVEPESELRSPAGHAQKLPTTPSPEPDASDHA
mgnify:CR=1 FL=1